MEFFGQGNAPDEAPSGERKEPGRAAPLAERMRPRTLNEFAGQGEAVGPDSFLRRLIERGEVPSLIFWGPPGCGKTTLARILADNTGATMRTLSAVTAGVKDARAVIEEAARRLEATGRRTILFVDEIHRFNKAQQDAFLPHVEAGTIVLFGATTENPSFSVVSPLLSRCRVVRLEPLSDEDLLTILERALRDEERGLGRLKAEGDRDTLLGLARTADGDARRALNLLEQAVGAAEPDAEGGRRLTPELVAEVARRGHLLYDASGEEHFNIISALHKSVRASDVQAALYWLARMLVSGEDPLYVGRRLVRMASEDIGLADPHALPQALAAVQAYQMLGSPEGELALVQATVYLATCPKSDSIYKGWNQAKAEVKESGSLPVPMHLRNAPTKLMKDEGYGAGYRYDHGAPEHFSGQRCLPEKLEGREFYEPGAFGYEREIRKRLEWWEARRRETQGPE